MSKFTFAIIASFLATGILAVPVIRPLPPRKPEGNYTNPQQYPDFVNPVFDIKYTPEQLEQKSGIPDERYRWRNGFIVHPDRNFNPTEYNIINDALYELSTHLCINVLMWPQDSNPTGDYVEIIRGPSDSGCWSYVGRLGGRQELNLQSNGCIVKYIVQHESIHALGYDHEQCRTDRDSYVDILWQNIEPQYQYAFDISPGSNTFGVPYDIRSIMQYASSSFSTNGQPTIVAKGGAQIPTNTVMTSNDVAKLQRMYNC